MVRGMNDLSVFEYSGSDGWTYALVIAVAVALFLVLTYPGNAR
jgi:hypothetical protein